MTARCASTHLDERNAESLDNRCEHREAGDGQDNANHEGWSEAQTREQRRKDQKRW
jgi:hypothetical protein